MSKNRIYVACDDKQQYAEVLKYKARNGHVWRQSQRPVECNNQNIREFNSLSEKGERLTCLGIHNEGGAVSFRVAESKGQVISFNRFSSDYLNAHSSAASYRVEDEYPPIRQADAVSAQTPFNGSATLKGDFSAEKTSVINNKKENNMKSIIDKFIPKKSNKNSVAITMNGTLAFLRKDGDYVRYDHASDSIEVQSILPTFKVGDLCFEMPTAIDQIKVGDIIRYKENYHEVVDTTGGLKTVNLNTGATSNVKRETIAGFGYGVIQKVVCLVNSTQFGAGDQAFNPLMLMVLAKDGDAIGGDKMSDLLPLMLMTQGQQGANPMANMLPFLALTGKDGSGLKEILPLMLMSQGAGATGANPMQNMLPLMLMSKDQDIDPMMLMLMSQGGNNPFGSFGAPVAPAVAAPAVDKDAIIADLQKQLEEAKKVD